MSEGIVSAYFHASHLAVLAFGEDDFQPAAFPAVFQAFHAHWLRQVSAFQSHPACERGDLLLADQPVRFHDVRQTTANLQGCMLYFLLVSDLIACR